MSNSIKKLYYIVQKLDQGEVNTTIKAVKALEDEGGIKRYEEDRKTYYVIKMREFCFEDKEDARAKVNELINYKHEQELVKLKKSQEKESKELQEKITIEELN